LTDDTITAAGVYSVRPADLPRFPSLQSGLAFPYPDRNGQVNGFVRIKLFPAVPGSNGHAMRYYQPPDTGPRLYFPPLLDWNALCADPARPLALTEGEKKALALTQAGVPAIGLGGLWNFLSDAEGWTSLLPNFDAIVWPQRRVALAPDSDVWSREDLLRPVALLGLLLARRGAQIEVVTLPESPGRKIGADDFLAAEAAWPHEAWQGLERRPLDHPTLRAATRWATTWIERQAVREAAARQEPASLQLEEACGVYTVTSPAHGVRFVFDQLSDARGGVAAELTITLGHTELLPCVAIGLKSHQAQTTLARALARDVPTVPWKVLLPHACARVLLRHRTGEPVIVLSQASAPVPLAFQVNPFVYQRKTTILFGDGGQGKSTFALWLGLLAATGQQAAGVSALKTRALYLDYEDDEDIHIFRLHGLLAGHPELAGAEVLYQRVSAPFATLARPLARRLQEQHVGLLIIDSLFAASAGSEAEQCAKFFAALRPLKVGALVLGHTPKPQDGVDPSIHGSVFNKNFARLCWEFRREQGGPGDPARIALFHRKDNYSPQQTARGFLVTQRPDGSLCRYDPCDLSDAPELQKGLPAAARIRTLLEDGVPRTAKDIADEAGLPLGTVKSTLSRENGRKWMILGEDYRNPQWTVLNPKTGAK
jgi:hypothetical protein